MDINEVKEKIDINEFNELVKEFNSIYRMHLEENRGELFAIANLIEDTYLHYGNDFSNMVLSIVVAEKEVNHDKIFIGDLDFLNENLKKFYKIREEIKSNFSKYEFEKLEKRIDDLLIVLNSKPIHYDPRC